MPVLRVQALYVFGGENERLTEDFHLTGRQRDSSIYLTVRHTIGVLSQNA